MTERGLPIIEVSSPDGMILVVVGERMEIGRQCQGVLLDDDLVSRRHLAMWPVDGAVWVEDLGSANGTLLDGSPLQRATALGEGQEIVLGGTTLRVSNLRATDTPPAASITAGGRDRGTMGPTARTDGGVPAASSTMIVRPAVASHTPERATSIEQVAAAVAAAPTGVKPDAVIVAGQGGNRPTHGHTLTFLFSDIEGSTSMAQALGDRRWFEVLRAHNQLLEKAVDERGGRVVKAVGDGYLCTFETARQALRAAVEIQQRLHSVDEGHLLAPVRVRMGLHTGEAIEEDGDVLGLHVNIAARVAGWAQGGQVVVSELTRAITETAGDLTFGERTEVELRGLALTYQVSELHWH